MSKKTKTVTKAYTWEQVDAVIVQIRKDGETLRQKIHNVAVTLMKHWHDNPTSGASVAEKMNALADAAGYHSRALGVWVQTLSPMKVSEENGKFYVHADDKLMGKAFTAMRDKPFWEVSPPSKPKPLDIYAEVQALIDRAQKRMEKPVDGDVIDGAVIRGLRDLARTRPAFEPAH